MPPRALTSAYSSIFNLSSLLQTLPATCQTQALTKCSSCLFSTTAANSMKHPTKKRKKKHADPYRLAQARQRRAANVAHQNVLFRERAAAMGDPVRSKPTPFVESLRPQADFETLKQSYLNYFLKPSQMEASIEESRELIEPLDGTPDAAFNAAHDNAAKAMSAIASLDNGSGRDKTRVNIQRCVQEFGRHQTDTFLPPKPASLQHLRQLEAEGGQLNLPARSGPDTGSSEVQIAILTAKINVLVDNLHKKDKHNKRNLRLLVHRRQKLLAYLRRKERGGPRWQNLVEKLGVNDAMWQGEISLP